jgi:SAM-dependent methyltransferase
MQNTGYLHCLRRFELERALQFFPDMDNGKEPCPVLDIGAGTGHQAQLLSKRGFAVTAVDIGGSAYRNQRVHPVVEYDGHSLPVSSGSIGVIFSSNVLEHVADIDDFLDEIRRVLVPGGRAIHVLPTPAWRLWTIVGHYGWLVKRISTRLFRPRLENSVEMESTRLPKSWHGIVGTLLPLRHGARGSTVTEMYYYSSHWWQRKFESHGYRVVNSYPTGLFYSGACVFGEHVSVACRERLSRWLGSACRIYVLHHPG